MEQLITFQSGTQISQNSTPKTIFQKCIRLCLGLVKTKKEPKTVREGDSIRRKSLTRGWHWCCLWVYNLSRCRLAGDEELWKQNRVNVQISSSDGSQNRKIRPVKLPEAKSSGGGFLSCELVSVARKTLSNSDSSNTKLVSQPTHIVGRYKLSSESLIMAQDERWRRA